MKVILVIVCTDMLYSGHEVEVTQGVSCAIMLWRPLCLVGPSIQPLRASETALSENAAPV